MDKDEFRRLTGGRKEREETPEEIEARNERLGTDDATIADVFSVLPDLIEQAQQHYMNLYGLKPAFSEEEAAQSEASFGLMSEAQEREYSKASKAYRKRRFPERDPDDHLRNLAAFAATNPPEVLRRHVWKLQRGLDEPLFGRTPERMPIRVREYEASVSVNLCDVCARELEQETENSGAEHFPYGLKKQRDYPWLSDGPCYTERSGGGGIYLFRYGEYCIERDKTDGYFPFPARESRTCDRCGSSDVEFWRERFGDAQ